MDIWPNPGTPLSQFSIHNHAKKSPIHYLLCVHFRSKEAKEKLLYCLVHYQIDNHRNEFKAIYKHVTVRVPYKFYYKAWQPREYTRHLNWASIRWGRKYMLHMTIQLWNGKCVIVIVIIHVPKLKIIPSFSFILKTWIQIAICLLKQVQVIHQLMIRIASTALTTMTNGQDLAFRI